MNTTFSNLIPSYCVNLVTSRIITPYKQNLCGYSLVNKQLWESVEFNIWRSRLRGQGLVFINRIKESAY